MIVLALVLMACAIALGAATNAPVPAGFGYTIVLVALIYAHALGHAKGWTDALAYVRSLEPGSMDLGWRRAKENWEANWDHCPECGQAGGKHSAGCSVDLDLS